jgi:hypothetical protein
MCRGCLRCFSRRMDTRPTTTAHRADGAVRFMIGSMLTFGVEAAVIRTAVEPVEATSCETCARGTRRPVRRPQTSRYEHRRPVTTSI